MNKINLSRIRISLFLFMTVLLLSAILVNEMQLAYAISDGTVNLTALPNQLSIRLQINLFTARVLASMIFIFIMMLPFALFGKFVLSLIVSQVALSFVTAIGWLDGWIMMLDILVVAGLFTFGFMSKMVK